MGKPILYLKEAFNEEQIAAIKEAAPDYLIYNETTDASTISINPDEIEICVGWNHELEQTLLYSDKSQLKWIQAVSAGVDTIALADLAKKGILLSNGKGIHQISISEHILGVLLSYTRGIKQSILNQTKRSWDQVGIHYEQLAGKKMLIAGTGHIGQQLAKVASGLGLQVYGVNTSGHSTPHFLECYSQKNMLKIVEEMDIVVNILPLTEQTYHLYNQEMFQAFKTGTLFVNNGRGSSVNTEDLIEALNSGQIQFAALDVFEEEPLDKESPLWEMEQVLITSHISGLTPGFKQKLFTIFMKNLHSYLSEEKLVENQVALTKGY